MSLSTISCQAIAFFLLVQVINPQFFSLHIFGFSLWANCWLLFLLLSALVTFCFLFRFPSQLICICMHIFLPLPLPLPLSRLSVSPLLRAFCSYDSEGLPYAIDICSILPAAHRHTHTHIHLQIHLCLCVCLYAVATLVLPQKICLLFCICCIAAAAAAVFCLLRFVYLLFKFLFLFCAFFFFFLSISRSICELCHLPLPFVWFSFCFSVFFVVLLFVFVGLCLLARFCFQSNLWYFCTFDQFAAHNANKQALKHTHTHTRECGPHDWQLFNMALIEFLIVWLYTFWPFCLNVSLDLQASHFVNC